MKAASVVRKLPLDQLVLSPLNVRKTPASAAEDAELKASLKACGLKQNLVVHVMPGNDDRFGVTAGGRRFRLLQELAAEDAIPCDYKVPCVVEDVETARETSLMENTIRAAMHPADEFVAMAELIDQGELIGTVATRFGVTERAVTQRLRLGKLAPKLLDAFRAGDLSLELAMAFTLASDHKTQLAAWRQVKNQPYPSAHAVKRLLTEGALSMDSALGVFVGLAAYEAAGGSVRHDLFSTDNDGFLDDAALVRRLAIEKLEAKAEELKSKWSWTKALLDPEYGFEADYEQISGRPAGLSVKLAKELEEIEQRLAELDDIDGDAWTDELAEEAERLGERREKLVKKGGDEAIYANEDRARSGCIVTISEDGDFEVHEGLIERGAQSDDDGSDEDDAVDEDSGQLDSPTVDGPSAETAVRKECGFSQTFIDDLKAHRLQITKAHLAGNFELAFHLTLYSLCLELLKFDHRSRPLSLSAVETRPRSSLNDLAGAPADRLLHAYEDRLETSWLELPPREAFEALSALALEAKQDLFAWCVAACLNSQLAIEDDANPVLERAGQRLAIPFAECWRPTAANYWGRAKKAHGLATAEAILGPRWAKDHVGDKKPTLAAALENAFDPDRNNNCIGLDQGTRERAGAWLPPGMVYVDNVMREDRVTLDGHERPCPDRMTEVDADADGGTVSDDLPAFLSEEAPPPIRPNGAISQPE